ncbi:MAG: hypothetical protein SFU84_12565 [Gemmatimonadales bacterium]|nr:hypothetical protein [Gemmatimonadales bacterium]
MLFWPMFVGLQVLVAPDTEVPRGRAPALDGVIDSLEWTDAARISLGTGSQLYLKHDGKDLFIGMRVTGPLLPGLCLERGDTIKVLHASASLGVATYAPGGAAARTRLTDFQWGVRDRGNVAAPDSLRTAWFEKATWMATTAAMGMSIREWRLRLADPPKPVRIGVAAFSPMGGGHAPVAGNPGRRLFGLVIRHGSGTRNRAVRSDTLGQSADRVTATRSRPSGATQRRGSGHRSR